MTYFSALIFIIGDEDISKIQASDEMATFGKIEEYNPDTDSWNEYVERLEHFFLANDIESKDKKKAILLSTGGARTYKLLRNLSAPEKPGNKTFDELVTLMRHHQNPKPSIIMERFKFNKRDRQTHESISTYMSELRRLSEFCEYGTTLDDM